MPIIQRTPEQIGQLRVDVAAVPFWWHTIDLGDGIVTPGQEHGYQTKESYMHLERVDFTNKMVLDVGTWDGKYAFYADQRGAFSVRAIDSTKHPGFAVAHSALRSKVAYSVADILDPLRAKYDVIMFLGVLYHLQDPMWALRNCSRSLTKEGVFVIETALTDVDSTNHPIMEFIETYAERDPHKDPTNWWLPNHCCVEAMLRAVGLVNIEYQGGIPNRGCWHARKA